MELASRTFRTQKDGNPPEDCDDAYAVSVEGSRFAVADGASDSFRSGNWADTLVSTFVADPILPAQYWRRLAPPDGVPAACEWLAPLQQSWRRTIADDWNALPWYKQNKARGGAHATLLGLEVDRGGWRAIAVGDTCLFHVRGETLVSAFPLTQADQFDTSPDLISTDVEGNGHLSGGLKLRRGRWRAGDSLILATDALACWALAAGDGTDWKSILDLRDAEAFASLVAELRRTGAMRNDDVTLMVVQLMPSSDRQRAFSTG